MPKHFMTIVKQHGALLAKGRLLGIQFDALFTDDLYFKISRHAIEMAEIFKMVLRKKVIHFILILQLISSLLFYKIARWRN